MLPKYSFGVGDRFHHQGKAQLEAFMAVRDHGVEVIPVWNKSNREHLNVHTTPDSVRAEADAAVRQLGWDLGYYVDADHINLATVDAFIPSSDFFTLDVADAVGKVAAEDGIREFVHSHHRFVGEFRIPGIASAIVVGEDQITEIARKYLAAVQQAGAIYRHVKGARSGAAADLAAAATADGFVTEVSMDETDKPQSPVDLLFILAAIAAEGIPAQTIAPRFSGRFNKGVDYYGEVEQFEKEFNEDLAVVAFAIREFGLPSNLKLSVHSGSDKFSLFGPIARALNAHDAGVHVKTSGTTWLEEVAGLALADGDALDMAKEIYEQAYGRREELVAPYAQVIDIEPARLPRPEDVWQWSGTRFAHTLRHDPQSSMYSRDFRQMVHVAYKVAAEMGESFLQALEANEASIAPLVTENLYVKHLRPLFAQQ